ncbi:hypothetical protein LINPERHAP2_LOCUS5629 [Linum perenne]
MRVGLRSIQTAPVFMEAVRRPSEDSSATIGGILFELSVGILVPAPSLERKSRLLSKV